MENGNIGFLSPRLLDNKLQTEKTYWLQKLSGELSESGIAPDFRRQAVLSPDKAQMPLFIPPDVVQKVQQVTNGIEPLVFTALLTALKICLHKYSATEDVIVGTVIHERHSEIARINEILALRDEVTASMTVRQLLMSVKRTLSEAYTHQKYPFDRLLEHLHIHHAHNRSPLFNVAAVLENAGDPHRLNGLRTDLNLISRLCGGNIEAKVEYSAALFREPTIRTFCEHFNLALAAVVNQPDSSISEIDLLSVEKERALVFDFNWTDRSEMSLETAQTLFEQQVRRTPTRDAVVCRGKALTYAQLNRCANKLARYLTLRGIGKGSLVGICADHSIELVVAILAVLKTGAAYVPMDAAYPGARLCRIISDAGISLVITQTQLIDEFARTLPAICLDAYPESIAQQADDDPDEKAEPDDLAYIIYTSGSTGEPKGIEISHAALANYISWAHEHYVKENLAFALFSSIAFDLTVTSIFMPLVTGNQLHIYPQGADGLYKALEENQVGILKLTPSHLTLICDRDNQNSRVKRLIVGGEALETELAKRAHNSFGGAVEIINEYGPTEATVGCMIHRYDSVEDMRAHVPIGRPGARAKIYILDESLRPVAEMVVGEIYIAGPGLARGYRGQADLTISRFIDDPFIPGTKMYKTGDLARHLANGTVEFLGRSDEQIKFNGHRIELNELCSTLNSHPLVRDSVVVLRKDDVGGNILVAYYVAQEEIPAEILRAHMLDNIVRETIPSLFVHLQELPLTVNGKIAHRALPGLAESRRRAGRSRIAPRTEVERAIAEIWMQVLGLQEVGAFDNFFELGGHSLLTAQVVSRIRHALKADIPMHALFETPTVAGLAATVARLKHEPIANHAPISIAIAQFTREKVDDLSDQQVDSLLEMVSAGQLDYDK